MKFTNAAILFAVCLYYVEMNDGKLICKKAGMTQEIVHVAMCLADTESCKEPGIIANSFDLNYKKTGGSCHYEPNSEGMAEEQNKEKAPLDDDDNKDSQNAQQFVNVDFFTEQAKQHQTVVIGVAVLVTSLLFCCIYSLYCSKRKYSRTDLETSIEMANGSGFQDEPLDDKYSFKPTYAF